jgi:hypothetical protein
MVLDVTTHLDADSSRTPVLQVWPEVLKRAVNRWAFGRGESSCAADKRQLIDEIRQFNPTATPRFLGRFDAAALREYLDHLTAARGRQADRAEPREYAAGRIVA